MAMRGYFKAEDEDNGEPIGPLLVYDDADETSEPEELDWMSLSAARQYARERGYELDEDL